MEFKKSATEVFPLAVADKVVVQALGDELLVYNTDTHNAFCLNKTSALVWNSCDGAKSVSEIRRSVGDQLDAKITDDFVWLALDQLRRNGLLHEDGRETARFEGVSRREAIKRVGLTTAAMLPVVASLAAPTPVQAQSCTGAVGRSQGTSCDRSCQCSSGCCRTNGLDPANNNTCRDFDNGPNPVNGLPRCYPF